MRYTVAVALTKQRTPTLSDSLQVQLRKGVLEMCVLALLGLRDR